MAKKSQSVWGQLVSNVADEKLTDPDTVLGELDSLGKSIDDLNKAVELLNQRRAWSKQVADGVKAETDRDEAIQKIASEEAAFEKLTEEHEARLLPLIDARQRAVDAINFAADARRRLSETAGSESRNTALGGIDSEIAEVQAERQALQRTMKDRRDWIFRVETLGESAATSDKERLPSKREGLKKMQQMDSEIGVRITALQDKRNRAAATLLRPECL